MMEWFAAIERSQLSTWSREDPYAYFWLLILHAFGMALLVGAGLVICLRAMGVGAATPLERFRRFFPVMWIGAALAVFSGVLLLVAYPAKALTNPVFGIKFACLIGAALLTSRLPCHTSANRTKAGVALALWLGGVAAGKLLLHTYTVLMVSM